MIERDLRSEGWGPEDCYPETDLSDLARCPFCGNKALISSEDDCGDNVRELAHIIVCGDCGTRGPWGDTERDAIERWNRRDGIV